MKNLNVIIKESLNNTAKIISEKNSVVLVITLLLNFLMKIKQNVMLY